MSCVFEKSNRAPACRIVSMCLPGQSRSFVNIAFARLTTFASWPPVSKKDSRRSAQEVLALIFQTIYASNRQGMLANKLVVRTTQRGKQYICILLFFYFFVYNDRLPMLLHLNRLWRYSRKTYRTTLRAQTTFFDNTLGETIRHTTFREIVTV